MTEVEIDWFEGDRATLEPLFALADDSRAAVAAYRDTGRVLVARLGSEIVGHALLIPEADDAVELKSLAVLEDRQRSGIGRALVERAIDESRRDGFALLLVATAAAATGVLRFYQRLGFRMLRIERDAFTPENGYPATDPGGIPLRDRVWLSLDLERHHELGDRISQ
jgi:GNAT superfamily N-acetyltransferase